VKVKTRSADDDTRMTTDAKVLKGLRYQSINVIEK
jgi:hypothetical protein